MTIRYTIWAAVSTEAQAGPETVSLEEQVNRSRTAAQARGWQETSGPYIVPGASRSYYVNLSDAETNIPALRQMLEDARQGRYDLLVIYSYDRLGDLVDMIAQSLRFYGVQLYSVSQPSEPQPPETFDPYTSDAEGTMRDVARITQRFRINDLRRKWKQGMPERVRRGLTPLRVPYGYRWTGKRSAPVLDPEQAAILLQIKDRLLTGKSLRSICTWLATQEIQSPNGHPTWEPSAIRYMLANPYYTGVVALGKSVSVRDVRQPRRRRQVEQAASKWQTAQGQHEPLWDAATHRLLLDELERRFEVHKRSARRYPLSGLLTCSTCKQKIHRRHDGWGNRRWVLACDTGPAHVHLEYDAALEQVGCLLANAIRLRDLSPAPVARSGPDPKRLITELKARRRRIQEGYEQGLYTPSEAAARMGAIEHEQSQLETGQRLSQRSAEAWASWRTALQKQPGSLDRLPEWIRTDDPALVNRLLTSVLETILVYPDGRMEFLWRQ